MCPLIIIYHKFIIYMNKFFFDDVSKTHALNELP